MAKIPKVKRHKWNQHGQKNIREALQEIKDLASEFIEYPSEADKNIIDFILIPAVSLQWTQNPIWAQIIGAPGSGKTLHIELFKEHPKTVFVSRLSENTLVSGYRTEEDRDDDPSLLPQLDGKIFIVKDFTTILQANKNERDAIVGQLRDIFDGSHSRAVGNIKGVQEYKSRFTMLLGVTPVIDQYYSINQQLGERFISYRETCTDRSALTNASIFNTIHGFQTDKMDLLRKKFHEFVNKLPMLDLKELVWTEEILERACMGSDFIALARSHARREGSSSSLSTIPTPEVGTRLASQMIQVLGAHSIITGHNSITPNTWAFAARVLHDTLPLPIAETIQFVYDMQTKTETSQDDYTTIREICAKTRIGMQTTTQIVSDLYFNGVFDKKVCPGSSSQHVYRLSKKSLDILHKTMIFSNQAENESG